MNKMANNSEVRKNSLNRRIDLEISDNRTKKRSPWQLSEIMWFVIVSGLAGALMNAMFTFFPSVMTTLEKRFNINNEKLSYILLANDISMIVVSPFCTFYMAKRHIPRSLALCK